MKAAEHARQVGVGAEPLQRAQLAVARRRQQRRIAHFAPTPTRPPQHAHMPAHTMPLSPNIVQPHTNYVLHYSRPHTPNTDGHNVMLASMPVCEYTPTMSSQHTHPGH